MRTITNAPFSMRVLAMATLLTLGIPLLASDGEGGYRLLKLDGHMVKWGEQRLGTGATISYAFAEETMRFDDARNCGELAPMRVLAGQHLPFETLEYETTAAFETWERAADLSFYQVDDARKADIVLGAQGQPTGWAFANVAYGQDSHEGLRGIDQALVCLNPDRKWKVGFDGNTDVFEIRYTLIHEIGHAIGLDHPGPEGQVMGFRYTEAFAGLQPGDVRGARRLYGPIDDDRTLANTDAEDNQVLEGPDTDDKGDAEAPPSLSIQ